MAELGNLKVRGEGKSAILSKVSKRNRRVKHREMHLNGAADMRRRETDCWNRGDHGVVWSFPCIAEQEGRIGRGEGSTTPAQGPEGELSPASRVLTNNEHLVASKWAESVALAGIQKDASCLIARPLKIAVGSLFRPARCRVSST